jgi:hypothetical protein
MKYLNKFFLLSAGLMLPVFGCDTDELHELNINPQAVTQISMNYLFTSAELSIAANGTSGDNRYTDWRTNIGFCGGIVQQLTTFGSISGNGNYWNHNEETVQCIFEFSYNDQLKNLAEVIKQTGPGGFEEGRRVNTRHAARVLRALTFARLTDFYGAVPYFEANQGIEGVFFPNYDNQSVIYADILKELDEAATGLSTTNADDGFTAADMIYKGDIALWKKWAYSLMLRYAMRVSNVDAAMANTYVQKAVAGGVFTSNADNVWIPMSIGPSEWTNQNGISRAFFPGDGGNQATLGAPLIDFLKGADPNSTADDDPRLMILSGGRADWTAAAWTPYPGGTDPLAQRGVPPGLSSAEVAALLGLSPSFIDKEEFSRINYLLLQDDDPYMIMNYAEVEFLLAEAAERGIGGVTGAATHYNNGVRAAMQQYTPYDATLVVSDAQVDAYLATYPYGSGGPDVGNDDGSSLNMIYEQLWVSHFLNWYDAWTDWRRTDGPALVQFTTNQSPITNSPTVAPVRLRYPNIEVVSNINFNQASKNDYVSKVWWDGGSE